MSSFDPKAFVEYITTMANIEANKISGEQADVAKVLEEQRLREHNVAIIAAKIGELEKVLKEERNKLTDAAIDAAKHRQLVVNALFGLVPEKANEESQKGSSSLWT